MNVLCKSKEIQSYVKDLEIEVEGEIYRATLTYDSECGYELAFYGKNGKGIEWPKWADKYDNATRSLDYDLDVASGMWEYCPAIPKEMEIAL
jgi:hypothetical protein